MIIFVKNTYSNTAVLKSFISGLKEYAEREKENKSMQSLQSITKHFNG